MKLTVSNYDNGIGTEDFTSREGLIGICEMKCGSSCDHLQSHDFHNSTHCSSLKYGDLNDKYVNDVIYGNPDDRDAMMSVVNIMCGNINNDCAHASYAYPEKLIISVYVS